MTIEPVQTVKPRRVVVIGCIAAVSAVGLAMFGISVRARSMQELTTWTDEQARLSVRLVKPERGPREEQLVLPGTVSAFNTGAIYARASGYVTAWHKDIGAHVKKGDVLASIDSPELDQQLAQARADLASAQANERLAQVTSERWQALARRNIVSQQAKDEKNGDALAKSAATQAAQANVARLEAMTSFKKLTAPFDGIVTARSVNIGDLVNAGGIAGKALFQVSDLHEMRIYVNVPQAFLEEMKASLKATLDLPGKDEAFEATLASTSNAISENSRTALIELLAENPEGKLWPGAFVEVHFHIPAAAHSLRIPTTALIFGPHGMRVATVGAGDKVVTKEVRIGRNFGNEVEVRSGLTPSDRVIDAPQESIAAGDAVRIADAKDGSDEVPETPRGSRAIASSGL